ncbi:hypothetical protein PPEP_a4404 [Pseudoalteromonas peptidolytica F12-50-A1]|uniref:Uncharacterized protein n=1 Tax=Pseudoalteromonas peptidolytica F12-50-A1 TaxID=1315280 RepID=A0A8I0T5F3_9GAMM|nr:hypothetical protein [Pseudoalteromonas peptidolytica F12-50-A1]GEK08529.1 hypothetical protein PPE03_07780 [Pseudoalteromonas peptidolytica]
MMILDKMKCAQELKHILAYKSDYYGDEIDSNGNKRLENLCNWYKMLD